MSLRDEIEKLIEAGRKNLERRDAEHSAYHQRQCERFAPLRLVLSELAESIEPEYFEARIHGDNATIEVGQRKGSHIDAKLRIKLEPNFDISWGAPGGESLFHEAPGFRITETNYFRYPEYDTSERKHTLESEQEVAQYLIQAVADKVAHYRHLASIRAKRDQGE